MGEMGSMEMPPPRQHAANDDGLCQFGPVEMGGMFTVVKVRPGLAASDYKDPGLVSSRKARSLMSGRARSSRKRHARRRPTAASKRRSSELSTRASVRTVRHRARPWQSLTDENHAGARCCFA